MLTNDDAWTKFLNAHDLADILNKLPASYVVRANQVGNLSVHNEKLEFMGYIDFLFKGEFIENSMD